MTTYAISAILIMALITAILRGLPFIIFKDSQHTPDFILYLGKTAPAAIIGMLVVYCLKDALLVPWPLPSELYAGISVVLLHLMFRNTLISIAGGVIINMLLIQIMQ